MRFVDSKKKIIGIIVLAVLVIGMAGFAVYVSDYYHADSVALAALNSTSSYTVNNTDNYITFTPTGTKSSRGIILYPGGKVQPEAYSVIASNLASSGYTTVIVKMPFNLAFFGINKADGVIAQHPEISSWVMMGHSLGGVFASDYALNHPEKVKGVVYLASYPSANASNVNFKALSIRGSQDALTTVGDIDKNKNKYPADTVFVTIEGGNHYNNGNYGAQSGDNNSTISREQQQQQTISAIIGFLNNL